MCVRDAARKGTASAEPRTRPNYCVLMPDRRPSARRPPPPRRYTTTGRASFMNSRRSGSGGDARVFFGLMFLLLEGLSHRVHELAVISEGAHGRIHKKVQAASSSTSHSTPLFFPRSNTENWLPPKKEESQSAILTLYSLNKFLARTNHLDCRRYASSRARVPNHQNFIGPLLVDRFIGRRRKSEMNWAEFKRQAERA